MRRRRIHCSYCDRRLIPGGARQVPPMSRAYTRDHVVPQSAGGWLTVRACFACNQLKGDMSPDEWAAYRATTPTWWRLARGCQSG